MRQNAGINISGSFNWQDNGFWYRLYRFEPCTRSVAEKKGKHRPKEPNQSGDFIHGLWTGKPKNRSAVEKAKEKYPVTPPKGAKNVSPDAPTDNFHAGVLRKWFGSGKKKK